MTALIQYSVYHRSRGAGSHLIRLRHPGAWTNHVSMFYARPWAAAAELQAAELFEARAKLGVTGPGHKGRTLADAIAGGDAVEVWQQFPVPLEDELAARAWLLEQLGKGYDLPGLAGFLPFTLLQRATLWQQRRKGSAQWWCSELEIALGVQRGQPKLQNVEPFQVDPEWSRSSPLQSFAWGAPENFAHGVR